MGVLIAYLSTTNPGTYKYKPIPYSYKDWKCLLDNIYFEARGEPVKGQVAVAKVTLNRANLLNKSICEVVYAPSQFSWTSVHHYSPAISAEIYRSSYLALDSNFSALYYHSIHINKPVWAKKLTKLGSINNHVFYK